MLLFLVTPCLVVAVQPCIGWIPIKKQQKKQITYVSELILTPFVSFDIECKKILCEKPLEICFRASRRVSFSYYPIMHSVMGGVPRAPPWGGWGVPGAPPPIPIRIFADVVTIFSSSPMQNLGWSSLWQKLLLTVVTESFLLKLVSAVFCQIFILSPNDKLFSVLRYSNFCDFFPFHTFQIQKDKWKWNNLWCHELTCINLQM